MTPLLFTRWLRAKQLPILLSIMLLAVTAMQSLHDRLSHDALHSVVSCEFCALGHGVDAAVLPETIELFSNLVDYLPETFCSFFIPVVCSFYQRSRAPPKTILSIS